MTKKTPALIAFKKAAAALSRAGSAFNRNPSEENRSALAAATDAFWVAFEARRLEREAAM